MTQLLKTGYLILIAAILFSACKKDPVKPVEIINRNPHPGTTQDTASKPYVFIAEYTDDYTGTDTFAVWFSMKTLHLPILDDPNITSLKVEGSLNHGEYSALHENSGYYGFSRRGGDLSITLFIFGARHIAVSVRITVIYH